MRPETAVALATLSLFKTKDQEFLGYRGDVVERVQQFRIKGNVSIPGVRILPEPDGLASADISNVLGRLASTGYIVQESPIRLTDHGVELLREHLHQQYKEGNPAELIAAAESVGIEQEQLEDILFSNTGSRSAAVVST